MKYIDVSYYQGVIDWVQARAHIDGAMLRAGYGKGTIDSQFPRNAKECNRLYIPCGAYWFSYAYTEEMARNEARAFLAAVAPYRMELPLAFDWEETSARYAEKRGVTVTAALVKSVTNAFCREIEAAGYWCMVYSNPSYISKYLGALAGGRYDLWLAQWPKTVDVTKPPRSCGIWQWGGSAVPGIVGNVDTNEAYRDYAAFLREKGFNRLGTAVDGSDPSVACGDSSPSQGEPLGDPSPAPAGATSPKGEGQDAHWYDAAMAWAKDAGIMDGTRPEDAATRAEVAQMFFNLTHREG